MQLTTSAAASSSCFLPSHDFHLPDRLAHDILGTLQVIGALGRANESSRPAIWFAIDVSRPACPRRSSFLAVTASGVGSFQVPAA